jgi:hypothetical protein
MRDDEPRTVKFAYVIPWEPGEWGMSIKYSNRTRTAYKVGNRDQAEEELRRLKGGAPAQKALA